MSKQDPTDAPISDRDDNRGLRERLTSQAEDAIGKLADELLENPLFNSALTRAFEARERVAQAQQSAMGVLNLPSASDLEKLERRIRSISHRLDEVEDTAERVGDKLESLEREPVSERLSKQLDRLDSRVDELARETAELRAQLQAGGSAPSSSTVASNS